MTDRKSKFTTISDDKRLSRRDVLKSIGLSGAFTVAPGFTSAASISAMSTTDPDSFESRISIEISNARSLTGEAGLVQVKLCNHSDEVAELKELVPGAFNVSGGEYNLNKRLGKQAIKLQPGAEYNLWLSTEPGSCATNSDTCRTGVGRKIPITVVERNSDNTVVQYQQVVQAVTV